MNEENAEAKTEGVTPRGKSSSTTNDGVELSEVRDPKVKDEKDGRTRNTFEPLKWITLIISLFSLYYAWSSVQIANESNKIANEAKESSEKLFLAEKRPYLNVYIEKLDDGSYLDTETVESNVIFRIQFKNEGGIPARDVQATIHFFDDEMKQYNRMYVEMPAEQKILPSKLNNLNVTMGYEGGSAGDRAIKQGELRFQVVTEYKSDVSGNIPYTTKKQFLVTDENVTLLGNTGEFY